MTELPAVTSWSPDGNDLQPACKQAATRHVEAAGNGTDRAMQVIFAQYGGLLTDSASVLVVTRSWVLSGNQVRTGGRTFDVRLSRHGATWRVDQVNPSAPGARAGSVSAAARRVLTSDRIDLPPDARADVASGQVHDSVLAAMLTLAVDYRVGISVVRSGHPVYVFGTDRLSDHPQGRAFDTWRIDGHPVVDARTSKALVTEYMQAAAAAGSYNVGGPYLLGSAPSGSATTPTTTTCTQDSPPDWRPATPLGRQALTGLVDSRTKEPPHRTPGPSLQTPILKGSRLVAALRAEPDHAALRAPPDHAALRGLLLV